jgi:hypothetical protein
LSPLCGSINSLGIEVLLYLIASTSQLIWSFPNEPIDPKARIGKSQWKDDNFDVLADGVVVGRIFNSTASPVGSPWMWTLIFGYHEDRSPTHGYEATREAAMAAFAKSWRREQSPTSLQACWLSAASTLLL